MDATIGQNSERVTAVDPAQRTASHAEARRRASQAALRHAQDAEARRADQRDTVRVILRRAVGADTRLSIIRNDAANAFVYRAIDIESGEIVKEWPPADFARFLEQYGAAANLVADALSGFLLDQKA